MQLVPQRTTGTWGQTRWPIGLRTVATSRGPPHTHVELGRPVLQPSGSPHILQEPTAASSLVPHQLPGTRGIAIAFATLLRVGKAL